MAGPATPTPTSAASDSSYEALGPEVEPPELIAERYRVRSRIGAGGFGVVYKAIDERLQKPVAIKVLGSSRAKNKGALERFRIEAMTAGRINHAGIVSVTDFEQLPDGRPYLVMEFVTGETLYDTLQRETKIPVARACRIARMMCQALDAAHKEGIIHRDLKPANVIVRDDPTSSDPMQLKILDFGVAKLAEGHRQDTLTQSGQVLGTPAYIAPEQIRESAATDGRADLYAVGVILYELVTGHLPFETRNAANLLVSKVVDEPDPPTKYVQELSPAFVKLVMRAIDRDPNVRPKNCAELAAALEPFLDPLASVHTRPPWWHARWWIGAAGVAVGGLAVAIGLAAHSGHEEPAPVASPPTPVEKPAPAPLPPPAAVVAPPAPVTPPAPPLTPITPPPQPVHAVTPPPKPVVKKRPPSPHGEPVLPDSPLAPKSR
jgi:serine/threonine-protein kinase